MEGGMEGLFLFLLTLLALKESLQRSRRSRRRTGGEEEERRSSSSPASRPDPLDQNQWFPSLGELAAGNYMDVCRSIHTHSHAHAHSLTRTHSLTHAQSGRCVAAPVSVWGRQSALHYVLVTEVYFL